jgi:hypothetical protein
MKYLIYLVVLTVLGVGFYCLDCWIGKFDINNYHYFLCQYSIMVSEIVIYTSWPVGYVVIIRKYLKSKKKK